MLKWNENLDRLDNEGSFSHQSRRSVAQLRLAVNACLVERARRTESTLSQALFDKIPGKVYP